MRSYNLLFQTSHDFHMSRDVYHHQDQSTFQWAKVNVYKLVDCIKNLTAVS